jgi:hypothetical protein
VQPVLGLFVRAVQLGLRDTGQLGNLAAHFAFLVLDFLGAGKAGEAI